MTLLPAHPSRSPPALALRGRLPRLHLPERVLAARAQRPGEHASRNRAAPRRNRVRLLLRLHPGSVASVRGRQHLLPRFLRRLRRRKGHGAAARGVGAQREARRVVVGGLEVPLAEIVAALEDRARPLAEEAFSLAFDGRFGLFGFGVEEDDFADARGNEGFLVDGQLGQAGEELALDVIARERAVGEGLEEEADAFEEVVLRVDDG